MKNNYTIADIARLSGVSKGTVDRVLHKRGRVSTQAESKVKKVLETIDYQPNIIAKQLKRTKEFRVLCIIPNPKLDPYWSPLFRLVEEYQKPNSLKISFQFQYFDPFNQSSFIDLSNSLKFDQIDLVILTPIFFNESIFLISQLKRNKIPYITFNASTELTGGLSFIGQNLRQSGQLSGHLLQLLDPNPGTILSFHLKEDFNNTIHMKKKQAGLEYYFEKNRINKKIISINLTEDNLDKMIDENIDLYQPKGISISNSLGHLVAERLRVNKLDIPFIAYDRTEENEAFLKSGEIDFIIEQNPYKQLETAIKLAQDYLIFENQPKNQYEIPLEIISKENL
ncbi:MAG: substrate-binding domain-containing protein [Flavobacteriaceae bacterium]